MGLGLAIDYSLFIITRFREEMVMRWPVPVVIVTLAALLLLGSPFLHASFSTDDASSLPAEAPARVVVDQLKQGFPNQENKG